MNAFFFAVPTDTEVGADDVVKKRRSPMWFVVTGDRNKYPVDPGIPRSVHCALEGHERDRY